MKRIYQDSSRNVALTQLKNVNYTISLTNEETPVCIHFGIREGFPFEKIGIHDNDFYDMDLHLDAHTILRETKENEKDEDEEIISLSQKHLHQPIDIPYTGYYMVTTQKYFLNLLQGYKVLSLVSIPSNHKFYILITELIENKNDLTFNLRVGFQKTTLESHDGTLSFSNLMDHLDKHYGRINWARMSEKTANLTFTTNLIKRNSPILFKQN